MKLVELAAAGASGEEEFFARLAGAGVMVGKRYSERNPDEVTGYRVALPGSMGGLHTAEGKPVWYGGAKLAADLSLPKLRAHWGANDGEAPQLRASGVELHVAEFVQAEQVEAPVASHDA